MDNDLFLVLGFIIGSLSIPSVISAFSESRPPRAAAVLVAIGGSLIVLAIMRQPGGYTFEDLPAAFTRVVAQYIR